MVMFSEGFQTFAFFTVFGGVLPAGVRGTKFRRSPLPHGGLKRSITLYVIKTESSDKIFIQMKNFVEVHYLEPEKILIKDEYQDIYHDFE